MNHNKAIGAFGEKIAKDFLLKRGYEIISNNIKASFKEIDLIVKKENILVFVEVKTRASVFLGTAAEMMSTRKLNNIKIGASLYLNNQKNNYQDLRFDFIAVDIDKGQKTAKIKHFKDII
ncbi:MAG: TIGR00252 family protein [Parcubacteria group bacterium GW2011_GWE2_38_18]|nr:MAG: TIGR00252 family protein [Parcubacteria group bacterium GW2011_GWE2_38_18]